MDLSLAFVKTEHSSLGQRVRDLRLGLDLTQKQLGLLSSSNAEAISKMEKGHSRFPRLIVELAHTLEVNPAWLMFGDHCADKSCPT